MAENSKIEWTDHTFNPWRGCTKIAAGCANCYADSQAKRNPKTLGIWGDQGTRVVASETMWREPLKWNAAAEKAGERHRVFCASMADVFEDWQGPIHDHQGSRLVINASSAFFYVREDWEPCYGERLATLGDVRDRLFRLIDATPNLDWLLLTKRPENIPDMISPVTKEEWGRRLAGVNMLEEGAIDALGPHQRTGLYRSNVWLGTSIANQADAARNIPLLLKCRDLAPVLFLSAEPLLGPVEIPFTSLAKYAEIERTGDVFRGIDWVICGGESGPHARPMHPDWARSLRDQCQAAEVPFFFKQWGEWAPKSVVFDAGPGQTTKQCPKQMRLKLLGDCEMLDCGKKAAGRLLDGREWSEFPAVEVTA